MNDNLLQLIVLILDAEIRELAYFHQVPFEEAKMLALEKLVLKLKG